MHHINQHTEIMRFEIRPCSVLPLTYMNPFEQMDIDNYIKGRAKHFLTCQKNRSNRKKKRK